MKNTRFDKNIRYDKRLPNKVIYIWDMQYQLILESFFRAKKFFLSLENSMKNVYEAI